jgi:hypothetical protein
VTIGTHIVKFLSGNRLRLQASRLLCLGDSLGSGFFTGRKGLHG